MHHSGHSHTRCVLGALVAGVAVGWLCRSINRNVLHPMNPEWGEQDQNIHLRASVNIRCSPKEVYDFWRRFENLPKVMTFLDKAEEDSNGLTHWAVEVPLGKTIEWTSKVVDDIPNEKLSWKSTENSDIRTWGRVKFKGSRSGSSSAPGGSQNTGSQVSGSQDEETTVEVDLNFQPVGTVAGTTIARFLRGLEEAVLHHGLRNLKVYLESGELPDGDSYAKTT